MNKMSQKKYCKKCGCELISTKRFKECDACRRKKVKRIVKIAEGVLASGAAVIAFVANFGNKKNKY